MLVPIYNQITSMTRSLINNDNLTPKCLFVPIYNLITSTTNNDSLILGYNPNVC